MGYVTNSGYVVLGTLEWFGSTMEPLGVGSTAGVADESVMFGGLSSRETRFRRLLLAVY